jgi:hypothetical protein
MELHAPESPIHSFKDFAIHIAVVTCGILIALGLEGVRETVHNHNLVRETRENVRFEMNVNLRDCKDEIPRISLYNAQLKSLITDLPLLARQHPEQINTRLAEIDNPGYFFTANSWQSALSIGALEHMSTDEVTAYGGVAESIRIYSAMQRDAQMQQARTKAFFTAHPHPDPDQFAEGTERLLLFYDSERALANVGPQMKEDVERALRVSNP